MKILGHLLILFLISTIIYGQYSPGSRQIALANSDVALSDDVFAAFNNPAGLAQFSWDEIGIYYSPAPFGLKELANGYGSYVHSFSFGTLSVGFMTYGFELYKENKFSISYSNQLFKDLFFGVSSTYNHLYIENYGDDNPISFSLGLLYYLFDDFRLGAFATNITKATYGSESDQLPSTYNFGISYDVEEDLSLNAAIIKETDRKESIRFGLEYLIIQYLYLRAGVHNNPSTFTGGVGINYSIFSVDYAIMNHQDLGLTHQFGIIVHFEEYENRNIAKKNYLGILQN